MAVFNYNKGWWQHYQEDWEKSSGRYRGKNLQSSRKPQRKKKNEK